jgi:ribose transport system substrate-binding protein
MMIFRPVRAVAFALAAAAFAAPFAATEARADPKSDAIALLAEHAKLPSFTAPGPAFDATKCMAGKSILSIPATMLNPFNVQVEKGLAEAAKAASVPFIIWENQGKVDQWLQGFQNAETRKVSMINLESGLDPVNLKPQIAEAHRDGIKIMTTHFYDVSNTPAPDVDASARSDYNLVGKMMADWAYLHSGGKPDVLVIESDELLIMPGMVGAIRDQLKLLCPDCKIHFTNAPIVEWATKIQPNTQAALIADPDINYIIPVFDSMSQYVVPALRLTGRIGKVKIVSYNGTPFVLDMLRNGQVEMDIGESLGWVGYAAMDIAMRTLCGIEPKVMNMNTPLYIFDKDNVATAGIPATFNDGYGNSHIAGFRKLWELK